MWKGGENLLGILGSNASTVVDAATWSSVISALTAQISWTNVVAVLVTLVTTGVGFVFGWWGVRKATRSLMAAFRKGKMSL